MGRYEIDTDDNRVVQIKDGQFPTQRIQHQ